MPTWTPVYTTHPAIKKLDAPILTKDDIPYEATLIFNAGVAKIGGKYVMVFRNDYGTTREKFENEKKNFTGTSVGVAISDNGIDGWRVMPRPIIDYNRQEGICVIGNTEEKYPEIRRLYDPRITVIDGVAYLCLAMDTYHGVRGCIAKLSEDLESYEIISASAPDNRNMVLFPEKIGGYYVRLERPFSSYERSGAHFDLWISKSPDLKFWGESELLLGSERVTFANDKIGPAAPPVKTKAGWLTLFHAVDVDKSRSQSEWQKDWWKRYSAGIMLLDLDDPSKIIGMYDKPLIAPELPFESNEGFRQNVIFPGGMILEDDGEVKIYYGAADTVECLATANVDELIALCLGK